MPTGKTEKRPVQKRKGWWGRFLDRLARANEEARKQGCRT